MPDCHCECHSEPSRALCPSGCGCRSRQERRGGQAPPWTVQRSAPSGDQHYQVAVQECVDSISNAMALEGISEEVRKRVLGDLGVSYGPPAPPPEDECPPGIDWPLAGPPPPWFEPGCPLCDKDWHRCPGCGTPLKHGQATCADCARL